MSNTIEVKAEIDFDKYFDDEALWDCVVGKISDDVQSKYIHTKFGQGFHGAVTNIIEEAISKLVQEKISDLISKPILKVDRYGAPKDGESETIDDMIFKAVENTKTEIVRFDGKPLGNDTFFKDGSKTRFEYSVGKCVDIKIKEEVNKVIRQLQTENKKRIKEQISEAVSSGLMSL